MTRRGSVANGARLFRHTRGQYAEGEIPSTRTAVQRARLRRAAANGNLPAQQALADYARERNERIKAELDRARKDADG